MRDYAIARFTDAGRLAELHAFVLGVFGPLDINPRSSMLKETVADFAQRLRADTIFVAESDGALIGSIFCSPDGDALYIGRLAVAPDWRRRGVASALMEAAKEEARRIGAARITLKARISLASNIALFRRHGFAITGTETHAGFSAPTSYAMELAL